jgi:hypothetical protein
VFDSQHLNIGQVLGYVAFRMAILQVQAIYERALPMRGCVNVAGNNKG